MKHRSGSLRSRGWPILLSILTILFVFTLDCSVPAFSDDQQVAQQSSTLDWVIAGDKVSHKDKAEVMDKAEMMAELQPMIEWDIGYELTYFEYEETSGGSKLMEEEGFFQGIRTAVTYHSPDSELMWRIAGRFSVGELEYDGQTQGGTPVTADTEDFILGLRGLVGWDWEQEQFASTLFTGLGYRYWNDEIEATGGYEREINWLYLPVGFEVATFTGDNWILGGSLEGNVLLYGWVKSHLSDAVPGLDDPTNEQEFASGYGIRSLLFLKRQTAGPYAFSVGIFADYWHVDKSEEETLKLMGVPIGIVWEPENDTTQVGLRFSVYW